MEDVVPITVKAGQVVDRDGLAAELVAAGYRREYQVEARGEFAVRGSILDVYPSTADHPVRIDLWGDEVDRLQTFSVADQRATGDIGVNLNVGYAVAPPVVSLERWGEPLAALGEDSGQ